MKHHGPPMRGGPGQPYLEFIWKVNCRYLPQPPAAIARKQLRQFNFNGGRQ